MARVVEPLVFQSLGLVGRRVPSAMRAKRARHSNGWPTSRADEEGHGDGSYASHPAHATAPLEAAHCRSLLSCVAMGISRHE